MADWDKLMNPAREALEALVAKGDEMADRIEELEANLAKAVDALERADRAIMDTTNDLDLIRVASVFDHMRAIRTTLAELKGEK